MTALEAIKNIFSWVQTASSSRSVPGLPGSNITQSDVNLAVSGIASLGGGGSPNVDLPQFSIENLSANVTANGPNFTVYSANPFVSNKNGSAIINLSVCGASSIAGVSSLEFYVEVDDGVIAPYNIGKTGCSSSGSNNPACASSSFSIPIVSGRTYNLTVKSSTLGGSAAFDIRVLLTGYAHLTLTKTIFFA